MDDWQGLCIDHFLETPPLSWWVGCSVVVQLGVVVLLFRLLASARGGVVGLGCGWSMVWLAPSSLVPTTDPFVERRAYGATVGPLLILASLILQHQVGGGEGAVQRSVLVLRAVFVVAFLALHVWVCRAQNEHFSDTQRVWASIVERYPSSPRPKHNLATILLRKAPKTAANLERAHILLSRCTFFVLLPLSLAATFSLASSLLHTLCHSSLSFLCPSLSLCF